MYSCEGKAGTRFRESLFLIFLFWAASENVSSQPFSDLILCDCGRALAEYFATTRKKEGARARTHSLHNTAKVDNKIEIKFWSKGLLKGRGRRTLISIRFRVSRSRQQLKGVSRFLDFMAEFYYDQTKMNINIFFEYMPWLPHAFWSDEDEEPNQQQELEDLADTTTHSTRGPWGKRGRKKQALGTTREGRKEGEKGEEEGEGTSKEVRKGARKAVEFPTAAAYQLCGKVVRPPLLPPRKIKAGEPGIFNHFSCQKKSERWREVYRIKLSQ